MRKISKKQLIVGGVAAAVIAAGTGTALAYWSTTGSGTGSATTTSGVSNSLAFTTSTINAMYPGDSAQNFKVTVQNTDANQSEYVTSVKAYLTVTPTSGNTCDATNYLLDGHSDTSVSAPVTLAWTAQELAKGASASTDSTDTIQFHNTTSNQDGCKDAAVTINYVAS